MKAKLFPFAEEAIANAERFCLVNCGECCKMWKEVFEDIKPSDAEEEMCPHMGSEGCELPRSQRPTACRFFLCQKSKGVDHENTFGVQHSKG